MLRLFWVSVAAPLFAQSTCPPTPTWSPCDIVFNLEPGENTAQLQLRAEFRSPRHRTYLMYGFRDGDRRAVIRFSPTEVGDWDYRLTSSLASLDGKEGRFPAMPRSEFDTLAAQRAKEKFTHLRVTLDAGADLREAAERVRAINAKGMTADLVLTSIPDDWQERERYLTDVVGRFAAF